MPADGQPMTETAVPPLPPHDLQAERAVLAAVLLDADAWWLLVDRVASRDFYDPRHALLWEVFGALVARHEPVDVLTVVAELRGRDRLNTVGGAQYVGEITDEIPTVSHCQSHARIVRDLARVRAIVEAAAAVVAAARGYGSDADAFAEKALAMIAKAAEGGGLDDGACSAADAVDLALSDDEDAIGSATAHWHLPQLEYVTGGLKPGQLILIGARPGIGKTALALETVIEAAADGDVLFASMEAPRVEVAQRMLARVSQVELSRWMRPADRKRLAVQDPDALDAVTAAANDLHQRAITIADGGRQSVAQIFARARKQKATAEAKGRRLALVAIDYLQLLQDPADLKRDATREQAVGGNARALKLMAMELGVPVVALSQLNRAAENEEPTLDMLRESGSLEQDANVVIFLSPEKDQDRAAPVKRVNLLLAKQRNGIADVSVELAYTRATMTFGEVDASERRDFTPERKRGRGGRRRGASSGPEGYTPDEGEGLPDDPSIVFPGETAPLPLNPAGHEHDDGTQGAPWP